MANSSTLKNGHTRDHVALWNAFINVQLHIPDECSAGERSNYSNNEKPVKVKTYLCARRRGSAATDAPRSLRPGEGLQAGGAAAGAAAEHRPGPHAAACASASGHATAGGWVAPVRSAADLQLQTLNCF